MTAQLLQDRDVPGGDLHATALPADLAAAGSRVPAETSLFSAFESLGEACEFGNMQQKLGVIQPHLLRFSAFTGDPDQRLTRLTAALRDDFRRLAEPDLLECYVPEFEWGAENSEYRCRNTYYGWSSHTRVTGAADSAETAKRRLKEFGAGLAFQRDKLLGELRLGRKIWIWKSHRPSQPRNVELLHDELQRHGPNTLLWVHRADADHPPGTIVRLGDRFFDAFIYKSDEQWSGEWSDSDAWSALLDKAIKVLPAARSTVSFSITDHGRHDTALALLRDVIATVVEDPDVMLTQDMALADVPGWDSLRHIAIIMEVELRLGCEFPPAEIDQMRTIQDMVQLIAGRQASR